MDPFPDMLAAVVDALTDGQRQDLNVELLRKIVQVCADTVLALPPDLQPEPPQLTTIKAHLARRGDLVWNPADARFVTAANVEVSSEMVWIEFEDGATVPYQRGEAVSIPGNRSAALSWNQCRQTFDPGVVDRLVEDHAVTVN